MIKSEDIVNVKDVVTIVSERCLRKHKNIKSMTVTTDSSDNNNDFYGSLNKIES